jgi:hypothetical protein
MTAFHGWISENLRTVLDTLLGGGAAAIVTVYVSNRQEKTKISLNIINDYLQKYDEMAVVRHLLENPSELAGATEINRVKSLGNWYEIVAALYNSRKAERGILEQIGIKKRAQSFYTAAMKASMNGRSLQQAVSGWIELKQLTQ